MMEHGIARAEEILTETGATRLYCSRTALNSPGHLPARHGWATIRSARW